jgi:hypothetical protein
LVSFGLWSNIVDMHFKDDLESLGYVLVSMITGTIPWKELASNNREEVLDKLIKLRNPRTLCKDLPSNSFIYLINSLVLAEIGKYLAFV